MKASVAIVAIASPHQGSYVIPNVRLTSRFKCIHTGEARLAATAAHIRALVRAVLGTRLVWSAMPDGTIIVCAKTKSILDMAGMLKAPNGKRVSVDDMNPWR